jgi:hypothetical protein
MSDNMNNSGNNSSGFNDFLSDFKFDAIYSELQAVKAMVTEMYNSRSYGRAAINLATSAAPGKLK